MITRNGRFIWIIVLLLLQGCVASNAITPSKSAPLNIETQEKILLAANNQAGLIEFYKSHLKEKESIEFRQKLAKTYLNNLDPESALFTIRPLIGKSNTSLESNIIASKAHMDMGQYAQAEQILLASQVTDKRAGEVANLLGIIYAEQGQLDKARTMFESARASFYDDVKVKNNLALLDMLEGDNLQALQRLVVLLSDEQGDPQLQANLMLIMAKNGQREFVFDGLDKSLTDVQAEQIYQALKNSAILSSKVKSDDRDVAGLSDTNDVISPLGSEPEQTEQE